jgi:hypothetical protein
MPGGLDGERSASLAAVLRAVPIPASWDASLQRRDGVAGL